MARWSGGKWFDGLKVGTDCPSLSFSIPPEGSGRFVHPTLSLRIER